VDVAELSVVILTGAGISADSGLTTFRGAGGLWEGQRVEDVATPEAWRRDPARVWRFYQQRRAALATVAPNAAHHALVDLERRLTAAGARFTLVTQNVDDLHERAGSRSLLHMHGELSVLRCERCAARFCDLERLHPATFAACDACGHARLRPDVVWFGERPYHLEAIGAALVDCTHFAAIGTSGVVYPAAGMLAEARAAGARTTVLALERPENAYAADEVVLGRAVETVPVWIRSLFGEP
jgi:NAD-dependent deacetylase